MKSQTIQIGLLVEGSISFHAFPISSIRYQGSTFSSHQITDKEQSPPQATCWKVPLRKDQKEETTSFQYWIGIKYIY